MERTTRHHLKQVIKGELPERGERTPSPPDKTHEEGLHTQKAYFPAMHNKTLTIRTCYIDFSTQ
jgi:hypothetical protein